VIQLLPGYDPRRGIDGSGLRFDYESASDVVSFYHEMITHAEGKLAMKPFYLQQWQMAYVGNLFGWKRADGSRRFRESLLYVSKKNGKTPLIAGLCNYLLFCDGEYGAQIYGAAGETDQAALLYRHACAMIDHEPELKKRAVIYGGENSRAIRYPEFKSEYKVMSSKAATKHGGNPHAVIIDELLAQDSRDLVDAFTTSMASENRFQSMIVYITTADYDRPSICNDKYEYACKVRDGRVDDWAFLPAIYELPQDADWTDETLWPLANPNLGVSVSMDFLRRQCKMAKEDPTLENTFRRFHLNQRTSTNVAWMQLHNWDQSTGLRDGETPLEWRERMLVEMKGKPCALGVDLSQSMDITAVVALFKPPETDGDWVVIPWFWVPTTNAHKRERQDRVPYVTWTRAGFATLTDDDYINFGVINEHIRWCAEYFDVREIGFDPYNARASAQTWHETYGVEVAEVRQGAASLSEPMKTVYGLTMAERLHHGGNPVLRWMVGNTSAKIDENENIRPDKEKSTERIDGVSATITAMARALVVDTSPSWGFQGL